MTPYTLLGFLEKFDEWCDREGPSDDLRIIVLDWIGTRQETPLHGVTRRPEGGDNYWFGRIPNTEERGEVVVCSFWVVEGDHSVKCDQLGSLSTPI